MKYVITKSNVSNKEVSARMEYIYNLFQIYTFVDKKKTNENITILKSIPEDAIDLCIIVGHDKRTDEYLKENQKKIKEKNIIIIACNTSAFSSLSSFKNKNIFTPQNGDMVNLYDGKNYGFNFDITDEEISLYRNKNESLDVMLMKTFKRR